jgi:hypothetical protein
MSNVLLERQAARRVEKVNVLERRGHADHLAGGS